MTEAHEYALLPGMDADHVERQLRMAHDEFVSTGEPVRGVRSLVMESWRRSLSRGVDPEATMPRIDLDTAELDRIRREHPLAAGIPVVRKILVESATESGLLVAVSDAAGQLLWVEGDRSLRRRAEDMLFVPGANWSESSAGTNAPGTALALDRPVQILGPEHLTRQTTPWSCSAAPVHDPDTGAILGVIDLTGGTDVATAQSLGLVRATAAAVEAELRIQRLTAATGVGVQVSPGWQRPQLDVLGVRGSVLRHGSSTTTLSLRHSELLLLLADAPRGYTTAELAVALSHDDQPEVTIRAELSRLRGALGSLRLASRPYRMDSSIETDVARLRAELDGGRVRGAVALYRGPVLPDSCAPAIEELRDEVHMLVRSHLLASVDADAILSFADTQHGRDDLEIWQHALEILPVSSPRYVHVAAHVEKLDAEYA